MPLHDIWSPISPHMTVNKVGRSIEKSHSYLSCPISTHIRFNFTFDGDISSANIVNMSGCVFRETERGSQWQTDRKRARDRQTYRQKERYFRLCKKKCFIYTSICVRIQYIVNKIIWSLVGHFVPFTSRMLIWLIMYV